MADPEPKRATNVRFPESRHVQLVDLAWRRRQSLNALLNDLAQAELDRDARERGVDVT